jgi:methyl-accepting chemotaxis protein
MEISAISEEISAGTQEVASSVQETASIAKQSSLQSSEVARLSVRQLDSMKQITAETTGMETISEELSGVVRRFKIS